MISIRKTPSGSMINQYTVNIICEINTVMIKTTLKMKVSLGNVQNCCCFALFLMVAFFRNSLPFLISRKKKSVEYVIEIIMMTKNRQSLITKYN